MSGPILLTLLLLVPVQTPDPYELELARARVVQAAVDQVQPALVQIETVGGAQPVMDGPQGVREEGFRLADGPTTGVIVTNDGLILTSSFNFARNPSIITVTLADGRRLVAELLGRDEIRRLAVLKVEAESELPVPAWVPRDEMRVGQYAIACGRGIGLADNPPFISVGIISALDRRNGNAVQTDAKVSPINYGGPLLDIDGRILGILVPKAGSGGALAGAEWYDSGIGFAIYKRDIDEVFDRLVAGDVIEQGKIGIVLVPDDESLVPDFLKSFFPAARGVKIGNVMAGSPAKVADLREGDRVLSVDGQSVGDVEELLRRLSDRAAGESITLQIKRRWRTFDVTLTLVRADEIGSILEMPKPSNDDAPAEAESTAGA